MDRAEVRPRVAVLVPCHNEEHAIATVVRAFRTALPGAEVTVADNASTDRTAELARAAGARVISEPRQGKGFAVRRLFTDVEADCYVLVDGDATYEALAAPDLVRIVLADGVDMVVGARVSEAGDATAYRRGHRLGNAVLTWIFHRLFKLPIEDTLSGYRVLSRRFVKSFPAGSTGFDVEAELNAHAAVVGVPVSEVRTRYIARPEGSESKLDTYRDGWHILRRNLRLFRDARPSLAFSLLALPWLLVAIYLVARAGQGYLDTGTVPHFPSLIAGVGSFIVAANLWVAGLVMERVTRNRNEVIRIAYLGIPRLHLEEPYPGGRLFHDGEEQAAEVYDVEPREAGRVRT
jgi:glycosyltransferase involved in cell wall biosynthesis